VAVVLYCTYGNCTNTTGTGDHGFRGSFRDCIDPLTSSEKVLCCAEEGPRIAKYDDWKGRTECAEALLS